MQDLAPFSEWIPYIVRSGEWIVSAGMLFVYAWVRFNSPPGYAVTGWLGIGVPKGTPADIVERLNREVNAVLAEPAVKVRMAELGSEIFTGSPADFGKLVAEETEKWAKVVKFAGIKPE